MKPSALLVCALWSIAILGLGLIAVGLDWLAPAWVFAGTVALSAAMFVAVASTPDDGP